jgi:Protein of unknown function DUF262
MIRYTIRSREIIDLYNDIKRGRLILSPFFQRNLVWRDVHKRDFIETILKGFPFPQIFVARGNIDVETMVSTSCIVDGQQRMSSIMQFIDGELDVDGRKFENLAVPEREEFVKYQVPVIDLDLRDNDPQLIEIFKRLNRTFYSLSTIERFATEYASSEFMLVAKILCDELLPSQSLELEDALNINRNDLDPNISPEFLAWAQAQKVSEYESFVLGGKIFTPYETSRMVHLMYTLNLMATHLYGFYNRNDKARDYLEEYAQQFAAKDEIVLTFDRTAHLIGQMKLAKGSIWQNKANAFTLFVMIAKELPLFQEASARGIKSCLEKFEQNLPPGYSLAAREAVNNRAQRQQRNDLLRAAVFEHMGF